MTDFIPSPDRPLKIGTRGSPLALAQAHEVRARLMAAHDLPEAAFAVHVIKTTGDIVLDRPLSEIGGKGLFTKEIQVALADGVIDLAVHSTKDVANTLPDGHELSTFLPREDPRDSFISLIYNHFEELPQNAVVGCSSIRRRAQMAAQRPDLKFVEFRGNVQTRLKKLQDGLAVATLLACAGLNRLGRDDLINPLAIEDMLPAVAQGAVGIEQRSNDSAVRALLSPLHDHATGYQVAAERAFLAVLDGSCRTPIGGHAVLTGDTLTLHGEILSADGQIVHQGKWTGAATDALSLGKMAGVELKAKGGTDFFG